jgi:phage shock protein PspC (stress-responsive transcriptional regulator)
MQKVITINLNGTAYQLDEQGYEVLRAYLDDAHAGLATNPDRSEILRDIEQAMAEKCMRVLGPGKTVVTTGETEQILREIGPVDSGNGASHSPGRPIEPCESTAAARRLYQIREGGMISGVCNGLAAHFNLDPTIVRVVFVLAGVIEIAITQDPPVMTAGTYLLLMMVVPYAKTSEELAAAQGTSDTLPFKVQRIVERVKAKIGVMAQARSPERREQRAKS